MPNHKERHNFLSRLASLSETEPTFEKQLLQSLVAKADPAQFLFLSAVAESLAHKIGFDLSMHMQQKMTISTGMEPSLGAVPQVPAVAGDVSLMLRLLSGSSDLVSCVFNFLDLATHHSFARTSKLFMVLSGLPFPTFGKVATWRKHVTLRVSTTDFQLQRLCSYARLISLDLRACSNVTDGGLYNLKKLPLQHLDLSCRNITDAGLFHLKKLPLRHLDLDNCANVTDSGLLHLKLLPLNHLSLFECRNITDRGLLHLAHLSLQHLSLSQCYNLTDSGLLHLQGLPLQHLELCECRNITDQGLSHLKDLPLQHLNLYCCSSVTDAGLEHLAQLPLSHLNLEECANITDRGLEVNHNNLYYYSNRQLLQIILSMTTK